MTSAVFGEFIGTLVLILLGDGVVTGMLLKRSKAEGSGWMVITTGWAFAAFAGRSLLLLVYNPVEASL